MNYENAASVSHSYYSMYPRKRFTENSLKFSHLYSLYGKLSTLGFISPASHNNIPTIMSSFVYSLAGYCYLFTQLRERTAKELFLLSHVVFDIFKSILLDFSCMFLSSVLEYWLNVLVRVYEYSYGYVWDIENENMSIFVWSIVGAKRWLIHLSKSILAYRALNLRAPVLCPRGQRAFKCDPYACEAFPACKFSSTVLYCTSDAYLMYSLRVQYEYTQVVLYI